MVFGHDSDCWSDGTYLIWTLKLESWWVGWSNPLIGWNLIDCWEKKIQQPYAFNIKMKLLLDDWNLECGRFDPFSFRCLQVWMEISFVFDLWIQTLNQFDLQIGNLMIWIRIPAGNLNTNGNLVEVPFCFCYCCW